MFGIEAGSLVRLADRMCAATRTENQAAGARLVAIGELDVLMLRHYGARETWCSDTAAAITGEIAAAMRISRNWADSYLYYARALRLRLPKVGAVLCAGDISYSAFKTIVYRTDLITDPEVLARVDATLAARAVRWPDMTRGRLAGYVDKIVATADLDALRQRREHQAGREVSFWGGQGGISEMGGRLFTVDAEVLRARLDALAATVCAADPRTRDERRADAFGALAAGAQRMQCRCGREDCAAAAPVPKPVVIHVVADQASVDGSGRAPGVLLGAEELIPAELLAELAESARLRPVVQPVQDGPESGYRPSQALADFVRCRDLTCRFPGCEEPAINCDLDHTIAYADGGPTQAANLKCMCRKDHLLKTFWGWRDQQLPDGTIIWTSPAGQTYVTTPGSALLFPQLCTPTSEVATPDVGDATLDWDRAVMMPRRRHGRAQAHARYVTAERRQNQKAREARQSAAALTHTSYPDDHPPPF
ncbi:HNH endonuclease signature motif containing protein [[Mycobacterium] crassicus]|uniref:HNH endonuclease signature motif containing protein n=1 Tax=[Mycobacterium] crassicus TaxID=2872309 RepID=A0ABU5XH23_9MYCO|nr:HNH endonuclease signature motif containing protein [Mycolicibacter sp. MYC098]MEB3021593.1 HNH endonuclease signature motif containing protein [Mycolicibacter sp. MYC098]